MSQEITMEQNNNITSPVIYPAVVKRIMVPTDLSDESQSALDYAVPIARSLDAELLLVHLFDDAWAAGSPFGTVPSNLLQQEEVEMERELLVWRDKVREFYPKCDAYFFLGNPRREIPEIAQELKIDLMIVSTHYLNFIERMLFGSDAERILHQAHCPVIIVHVRENALPGEKPASR